MDYEHLIGELRIASRIIDEQAEFLDSVTHQLRADNQESAARRHVEMARDRLTTAYQHLVLVRNNLQKLQGVEG